MSTLHEFTHTVAAAKIGMEPYKTQFKADARQCELLAKRYNITSVEGFSGHAELCRESDGMTIAVKGYLVADVTQACVATLEPVSEHIEEEFEGWFLDESQAKSFKKAKKRRAEAESDDFGAEEDEDFMPDEKEDPEPVVNGMVDVGELAAQYLSLAINPYPHSGKALEQGLVGNEEDLKKPNPFAVLKDMGHK